MWLLLKWTILTLIAAVYVALGLMYWKSSQAIDFQYDVEPRTLQVSASPGDSDEGRRLATVYGCTACHGERLQGKVIEESELKGRIVAPNLTRAVEQYSLSELEMIVRQGVRPDGTSVFGMPTVHYSVMTDRDFSSIVSFLRLAPKQYDELGRNRYGLLSRYKIVSGDWSAEASVVRDAPWPPGFKSDQLRFGEYVSRLACDGCHNPLNSSPHEIPRSLDGAGGYDRVEFKRLLREGETVGGRTLASKFMFVDARFSQLTEAELDALYIYLLSFEQGK